MKTVKGDVLKAREWCAANLQASLPEHGVTLSPDMAVVDEQPCQQATVADSNLCTGCRPRCHPEARRLGRPHPPIAMVQLCRSLVVGSAW